MKLKNIEIMNSIPVINKLLQSDIDITVQFILNKNTSEINSISKAYVDGRNKLLDKYVKKDDKGNMIIENNNYVFDEGNTEKFLTEMDKLDNIENDVKLQKLNIEDLKGTKVTGAEFKAIKFLIK